MHPCERGLWRRVGKEQNIRHDFSSSIFQYLKELDIFQLGRIPGYRWERMVVCPFVNYGEPVRRRRSFWVGRRLG